MSPHHWIPLCSLALLSCESPSYQPPSVSGTTRSQEANKHEVWRQQCDQLVAMLDKLIALRRSREFPWDRLVLLGVNPSIKGSVRAGWQEVETNHQVTDLAVLQFVRVLRDVRSDSSWDGLYEARDSNLRRLSLDGPYHGPDPVNLHSIAIINHMTEMLELEPLKLESMLDPIPWVRLVEIQDALHKAGQRRLDTLMKGAESK